MKKDDSKHIPKSVIQDLNSKIAELTDALQRERADAMNVRRRAEQDKAGAANFYRSLVVRQLLPALDTLETALKHVPKDLADHDYIKGIQSVAKQFDKSFEQLGLERIKTNGEEFDPRLHEAISVEDEGGDKEVVGEELKSGYQMGEEVIRPAMVRVKRGK